MLGGATGHLTIDIFFQQRQLVSNPRPGANKVTAIFSQAQTIGSISNQIFKNSDQIHLAW
jgi:hypothetical protein